MLVCNICNQPYALCPHQAGKHYQMWGTEVWKNGGKECIPVNIENDRRIEIERSKEA